ncbi:hypothetical protein N9V90_01160 [Endozoicomonas sp.]|nr:hypothetical protein [Endozoicomonas sp.]
MIQIREYKEPLTQEMVRLLLMADPASSALDAYYPLSRILACWDK